MQKLLILGWGDAVLMTDLLSELDHGPSALPPGSEVTLFNTRTSQEVMGRFYSPWCSVALCGAALQCSFVSCSLVV